MDCKKGLFLVICDDPGLAATLAHIQKSVELHVFVPGEHGNVSHEKLANASFFKRWKQVDPICIVLSLQDKEKHEKIRQIILSTLPAARILSLQVGHPDDIPRRLLHDDRELVLSWTELLSRPISAELRHIESAHRVYKIRELLGQADKIALLLQPDPDPDGLASALALRVLLGRNKASTPIVSFGKVTRPENLAMMKLLDLEVLTIKPEELEQYDRVALLDTQPSHFSGPLARVDAVIDHHPHTGGYDEIPYCDIRSRYGATCTILTEYLRAAAVNIGQRLATALIYGIKSDTLLLNREVIDADLYAFMTLYPNINYNMLRRIEKPEIPQRFASVLAHALTSMEVENGVLVSCLGAVEREDLIPQVADFLLQFEGVEWVICVGLFENNVVMSVRNVGYVKNAGDVVKRIVHGWGAGGGHRSMAKAIFESKKWKKKFGSLKTEHVRSATLLLFLAELERI